MSGRFKPGFTFIELVIVVLLLGIIGAISIPNLRYLMPGYKRKEFVTHVSGLVQLGWQNALVSQKLHRLFFDLKTRTMRLEIETRKPENTQEFFEPVKLVNVSAQYQWPDTIEIKQFFIDGNNVMGAAGFKAETMWFYIVPEGMVQEVIINLVDTKERDAEKKPFSFSLVVNPFTANLKMHEGFSKP